MIALKKNFYHRPYKCGILPHLAQPSFTPIISAATEAINLKFVIKLAFWEQHAKNNFRTKIDGSWLGEHSKNFGTPTTAQDGDFKFRIQLGVAGLSYKNYFYDKKNYLDVGQGEPHKFQGAPQLTPTPILVLKVFFSMLLDGPQFCTKFQVVSFSSCKNKQGIPKFLVHSHAHIHAKFSPKSSFGMLLVELKLCTKFEVAIFKGCRNKQGSQNLSECQIWENPTFFKEFDPATGFLVPTFSIHFVLQLDL